VGENGVLEFHWPIGPTLRHGWKQFFFQSQKNIGITNLSPKKIDFNNI
jgi:hypothetical protein